MLRKLLIATAVACVFGAVPFATYDGASAQGRRDGMARGGGARMPAPRMGGAARQPGGFRSTTVRRPGGLRPTAVRQPGRVGISRRPVHQRFASPGGQHRRGLSPGGHRRGLSPGGHRRGLSPGGHRRGLSPGGHRRGLSPGGHRRGLSPGGHRRSFSWGPAHRRAFSWGRGHRRSISWGSWHPRALSWGPGFLVPVAPIAPGLAPAAPALVSGPAPCQCTCLMTIYKGENLTGENREARVEEPELGIAWDEQIASIYVSRGTWEVFQDRNYQGESTSLPHGPYGNLGPQWTRSISSLRCAR